MRLLIMMIGVTLSSPNCDSLAMKAADRFSKYTGITDVLVVRTSYDHNYKKKTSIQRLFSGTETIVYFDSDLWFIRPVSLGWAENRDEFIGCHDGGANKRFLKSNHFPARDCQTFRLNEKIYINTGFFVFNHRHRQLMELAFDLAHRVVLENGVKKLDGKRYFDFGEQSCINIAIQRTGTRVLLADKRYNYMPFSHAIGMGDEIQDPYAIHGAGFTKCPRGGLEYAEGKEIALRAYEYKYHDPHLWGGYQGNKNA